MELLILSFLVIIIFLSGCGINDESQQANFTPEEKDEALKFGYEITDQVLPGQVINMKITLTSQVKDNIDNIKLRVTDPYGLKLLSQNCVSAGGNDLPNCGFVSPLRCGCEFSQLEGFEDIELNLIFKVPGSDEIARIGRELEPEFTITYDYRGESKYRIPILREGERTTTADIEETQTKGPIHVEMERGFTSSNYNWERSGSQFSIVIRVRDVLTSKSNVEIDRDKFNITLNRYLIKSPEPGVLCDFVIVGTNKYYNPKININLPMKTPIVCALEATNDQVPWAYGEIKVNYNYTYKTVKTERIDVEIVIV